MNDTATFGGFTDSFLTAFRDEFPKLPCLTFSILSRAFPGPSGPDDVSFKFVVDLTVLRSTGYTGPGHKEGDQRRAVPAESGRVVDTERADTSSRDVVHRRMAGRHLTERKCYIYTPSFLDSVLRLCLRSSATAPITPRRSCPLTLRAPPSLSSKFPCARLALTALKTWSCSSSG